MKLFIGCSSSDNILKEYLLDCEKYLNELLASNDVVFGVCSTGLMGMSYNIAKLNGNKVTGICPEVYKDDLLGLNCDEELLTTSIFERTDKVIDNSDGFVFLPGGIGTIYELFSIIELKRNKVIDKPVILYNSCHFFDELLVFLNNSIKQGFISEKIYDYFCISESAVDTLEYLEQYNNTIVRKKLK